MSRLRIFRGEEAAARQAVLGWQDQPAVLPFQSPAAERRSRGGDPLNRARMLRTNDCCPRCNRANVEPLELADGLHTRSQLPIPGTATLVGFHCLSCHWEWPA